MKRVLLAWTAPLALGIGMTTSALGADLTFPAEPVPAEAVPAADYVWGGCYIGANVGAIRDDSSADLQPGGNYENLAEVAPPPNALGTGLLPGDFVESDYDFDDIGITGGVAVGCDSAPIGGVVVIGVEADIQWSGLESTEEEDFDARPSENPLFTVEGRSEEVTSELDWFSTVRARAGITPTNRVFVYGTVGVVWGDVGSETNVDFENDVGGGLGVYSGAEHSGDESEIAFGGVIGGGAEVAFNDRWSAKFDYLYLRFEDIDYESELTEPDGVAPGYHWETEVRPRFHVARVGVNRRF